MKTKHIVTKESTRFTIKSGKVEAANWSSIQVTAPKRGSDSVQLDAGSFYFDAAALRDMVKLFKKLANALERTEVL